MMTIFYLENGQNVMDLIPKIQKMYQNQPIIRDFLLEKVIWEKCEYVENRWRPRSYVENDKSGYWEIYNIEKLEYSDKEDDITFSHFKSLHDDIVIVSNMEGNLFPCNKKFKGKIIDR